MAFYTTSKVGGEQRLRQVRVNNLHCQWVYTRGAKLIDDNALCNNVLFILHPSGELNSSLTHQLALIYSY